MLKTKKKFLLIALLSAIAMLCSGMTLLFTPTSASVTTNTNLTVKATGDTYYIYGSEYTEAEVADYETSNDCHLYVDTTYGIIYKYDDYGSDPTVAGYTSAVTSSSDVTLLSSFTDSNGTHTCTSIDEQALYNCPVRTLRISEGYDNVDYYCGNCPNLQTLYVPSTLYGLSSDLTSSALQNLYVPNLATFFQIDWSDITFYAPSSNDDNPSVNLYVNNVLTTSLTVPDTITDMSNYGYHLPSLGTITSVTLPSTLTSLDSDSIGSGVNEIVFTNNSVFTGISDVSGLFFWSDEVIQNHIKVPAGLVSSYRNSGTWSEYANYIFSDVVTTNDGLKYGVGASEAYLIDFPAADVSGATITIPATVQDSSEEVYYVTKILAMPYSSDKLYQKNIVINANLTYVGDSAMAGSGGSPSAITFNSITVPEFNDYAISAMKIYVPIAKYSEYWTAIGSYGGRKFYCGSTVAGGIKFDIGKINYNDEEFIAFVTGYTSDLPSAVTIPATITLNNDESVYYNVKAIDSYAFAGASGVVSMMIPASVTSIGSGAISSSVDDIFTASQVELKGLHGNWKQYTVENNAVTEVANSQTAAANIRGGSIQVDQETVYTYKHWIKSTVAANNLSVLTLDAADRLSAAPEDSNLWVLSADGKSAQKVVYNSGLVGPLPTAESGEDLSWSDSENNEITNSTLLSSAVFSNNEKTIQAAALPEPPAPPETGIVLDIILPSVIILLTLITTVYVWRKKEI